MSTQCPVLEGYDPLAPDQLADPYPWWARARREAPVFFTPAYEMWTVTSYRDVLAVLRDTETFSSATAVKGPPPPAELTDRLPDGYPWEYPTLVNLDPPAHARIRKLCQEAFGPRHVSAREGRIVEIADQLIEVFQPHGAVDLVAAYAAPLPLTVMTDILGVPRADLTRFKTWTDDAVQLLSPMLDPRDRLEKARRAVEFRDYCAACVSERRRRPSDDLISDLVTVTTDDGALSDAEVIGIVSQLLIAGSETTSNLISHTIVYLLRDPEQLDAVIREPSLLAAAIEESLRRRGPSKGLFRRTTCETELGGATLPAGALVHVLFSAANHDEAVFAAPERFDLHRDNLSQHVAFGRWTHFCLGAPLARLEGRIAVGRLLARIPGLRLADDQELDYAPTLGTQSLRALSVNWNATTGAAASRELP